MTKKLTQLEKKALRLFLKDADWNAQSAENFLANPDPHLNVHNHEEEEVEAAITEEFEIESISD